MVPLGAARPQIARTLLRNSLAAVLLAFAVARASAGDMVLVDFASAARDANMTQHLASTVIKGVGSARLAEITFNAASPGDPATVAFSASDASAWNLAPFDQVSFTIVNPGPQPVQVFCRVDNAWATNVYNRAIAEAMLAPGATTTVAVPFAGGTPWTIADKTSGAQLSSDRVVSVSVIGGANSAHQTISVTKITAGIAPPPALPAWLGKRPPAEGNWAKTLDENFDGATLNAKLWTVPERPEASIWDTVSVNCAANATVGNGTLRIQCDAPKPNGDPQFFGRKYQTSVVTSFDRWSQRYGYFEARMKLPTTLGLWPGFWLMPDRGKGGGGFWPRQETTDGGMEFDIMEHLVRFGPYRYNVALHWDGYGKHHQTVANELTYCEPDKDGYITSGMLWEPGKVTFYANGAVVGSWSNPRVGVTPAYILFTMPLGGWGTNGFVDDAKLPDAFQIDYVRAWQRDDLSRLPPYDPKAPPPVPSPAD